MRTRFTSYGALVSLLLLFACSDEAGEQSPPIDLGTPLLGKGTAVDTCAPTDGLALMFTIGTDATCTTSAGADPQVDIMAYPASTSTLAAGQKWSFDETTIGQQARVWWYPESLSSMPKYPKSGFVEVMSVSPIDVKVRYTFLVEDGSRYGGEASLWLCATKPSCG